MDNTSAVTYVNCLGGTHSLVLSNLALALWEWHSGRQWRRQVSEFGGAFEGQHAFGGEGKIEFHEISPPPRCLNF